MPYRLTDHTADLALEVSGATLAELCVELVAGLAHLYAGSSKLSVASTVTVKIEAPTPEALLVRLANEVIYRFDSAATLPLKLLDEQVGSGRQLCLTGSLAMADTRQGLEQEVDLKAATYHRLAVEPQDDGTLAATIVLDT